MANLLFILLIFNVFHVLFLLIFNLIILVQVNGSDMAHLAGFHLTGFHLTFLPTELNDL